MGRGGFEMVFGLAGAQPVMARRRGMAAVELPVDAAAVRPVVRRLFVRLGEPARAALGGVDLPVTLGVPVAALALTPLGTGFVAETPLEIVATDETGRCTDLPASHLTIVLWGAPGAGTYARFQIVVRIREVGQALRFSVHHAVSGLWTSGEAA
jgi:hypothetical protein